ncbi:MAG: 30S ribosomal protein S16 [Elusimicrobiota bacterium]
MAVTIKLRRLGKSLCPDYRVVAIDSKKRKCGKPLEELGHYSPRDRKNVLLKMERINYWIKTGAIVSNTVKSIIEKFGKTNSPQ